MCKHTGVTVFQYSLIYKNDRWPDLDHGLYSLLIPGLDKWFSTGGNFISYRHCTMSGGIFGYHNWECWCSFSGIWEVEWGWHC